MSSVSVTITVGVGSEGHNHDLEYRSTLQHVHGGSDDVIELVDYKSYEQQINDLMKPYIDEYNKQQEGRYKAAWDRYNSGQIKTKPRKSNYKPMSYNYYQEHLNDTYFNRASMKEEKLPIFRSLILGLGDREDRQNGTISRDQAVAVISGVVEDWPELFPNFKLLGATIHMDEEGFYHAHIDYKPLYECKNGQGLDVGIGHEAAMESMGIEAEQSIINASDKVPIRFNGFRNKLYLEVEKQLATQGLRLEYDVSRRKDPSKNSAKNLNLEAWQAARDAAMDLQHAKNHVLDVIQKDDVSPEEFKEVVKAAADIQGMLDQIEKQPRSRLDKSKVVVEFKLFDQLKSFVADVTRTVGAAVKEAFEWKERCHTAEERAEALQQEVDDLKDENADLREQVAYLQQQLQQSPSMTTQIQLGKQEQEIKKYRRLLQQHGINPDQKEHTEFRTQEKTREI